MIQGKCPKCRNAFRFSYPKRLSDAYCPDCKSKLQATTHLYKKGEWFNRDCWTLHDITMYRPDLLGGKK